MSDENKSPAQGSPAAGSEADKKDKSQAKPQPAWLSVLGLLPSLVWTVVGLVVIYQYGPEISRLVRQGAISKIGLASFSLELVQQRLRQVKGLDGLNIPADVQKQLQRRFSNIADADAHILWVDDDFPYENVRERRVLAALSVTVDLARSTDEAFEWLNRAQYDVLITDLTRARDVAGKCPGGKENQPRAGCDFINKVQASPDLATTPIIVYAGNIVGIVSPTKNLAVTNRAGDLFNAIIDAVERIKRPE
jgi:hypothetical protein